jgi:hypothetical protein
LTAQQHGAVTRPIQEAPMSFLAQALALLPAGAALAVIVAAVADHRETARLNSLRELGFELPQSEDLESYGSLSDVA